MPTVGRALAAERIRQGLDLDDVARVTKIGARFLRSIEYDDFEQLPGLVFARNFVRQYAECLRMDPTSMVEQFDRERDTRAPQFAIPRRPEPEIHVPPISSFTLGKVFDNNTVSAFVTFVLTIAVCAAAFAVYQYWRSRQQNSSEPSRATAQQAPARSGVTPNSAPAPAPLPAPSGTNSSESAPPTQVVPNPTQLDSPAAAAGNAHLNVSVMANEQCWLRITADGKVLFAGTLAAGDTRLINASENVNLRAGNAGALSIRWNGNEVPPVGPKGQVRTVVITPAGAQVLTPNPEPALDF